MAELLIVLMMAFNLWMVIYLTWERREDNKAEDGKGKDCEMKGMPDDIVGKSRFRMAERKPQAATMKPNAATDAQSEDVDEKDVTFADETPERHPRQVPDGELDEVFADSRVSDMAEYDEDEEYDGEPHEAGGLTRHEGQRAVRDDRKEFGSDPQETERTDGLLYGQRFRRHTEGTDPDGGTDYSPQRAGQY